jgi:hypothetical protein
LINVPSVKGHKAWRNFLELRLGEVRRINLPRRWVNKGPGPVGGGPGRTFRAVGCKVGRLSCAGHDQAEGLVRQLPPETVFTTTVLLFLDYDMVGKPTPAPRAGCGGFHVGVAALRLVEVDHEAERSDTANLTPDSMRTHRARCQHSRRLARGVRGVRHEQVHALAAEALL